MKLKTFIDRPVLAIVISVFMVLAGFIGFSTLPVEQYPDIAPPTVMVTTAYTGASAETVQKAVIAPLEEAINGVENMMYMTSTATNAGSVEIMVYFRQGTNPDMAAVNVQNRISRALGMLPAEVTRIGVSAFKRQNNILKIFSLYSPDDSYDMDFLSNYISINLKPVISRIEGVGDIVVLGNDYSMRVWMKPDVMAHYGLVPSDVTYALAGQNIESAAGTLGENSENAFQYTMKYKGRLVTPEEFSNIVIRSLPTGEVLRLGDIADVEMGAISYAYNSKVESHPGITCMVFQTAGSNASQVVEDVEAFLDEAEKDMPEGVKVAHLHSVNNFLYASIASVVETLIIAILLVVLVVYLFLQDLRSTLIPTIAIFVSIIGTFAFMAVAGFSINLLTLFAMVLAIGTVVDNAIIVVEAVQARFEVGYRSSYMATNDAMGGISSAIIVSTLVFMAVFIPTSMMGGTSGTFYTQFGITMAVAVGLSAINALTLSPALCAIMLKPYVDENGEQRDNFSARFRKAYNIAFTAILDRYKYGVLYFIRRKWLIGGGLVAMLVALVLLMNSTKTGLVPDEDQGVVFINVNAAPGTSLNRMSEIMEEISSRVGAMPEAEIFDNVAGYGLIAGEGSSYGMITLKLKDWSERKGEEHSVNSVINRIYAITADLRDASVFALAPAMIPGYGTGNGFELHLQDRTAGDINTFFANAQQFIGALNARPEIGEAYSTFSPNFPQWRVELDAAKCIRQGTTPDAVLDVMAGYFGGQYVSNFNRFSKVYRVILQSSPEYRLTPESLDNTFVRTQGGMAPLSQFVTLEKVYGAESLSRFNMFNSIAINGTPAEGYSSGDALRAVEEVAAQVLPATMSYEFAGIAREEQQSSSNTVIIYTICIVLIYLILAALYESFVMPIAIIIAIPCGLMGSFAIAKLMGLENNIYLQTGLIMLIGLLAKTAILITEYAGERRRCGMSLTQSAIGAAKARLRPILMTALTMVFGMLPMVFSSGVGANGNATLGAGAVGGMVVGTLVLLFFVPGLWITFQWLQEQIRPIEEKNPDWAIEAEMEYVAQLKEEKEKQLKNSNDE